MNCDKCGNLIHENDKFCGLCGNKLDINQSNQQLKNESFDTKLIKAYIGKKADVMYEAVNKNGIYIWGFLLGVPYYMYRKMYLVTFIYTIMSYLLSSLIPGISGYLGVFIGLAFCPLYKWDITRKLRKLKKNNPFATEEQLVEMAKNRGGTSITAAIIYLLLFIFGFIALLLMME